MTGTIEDAYREAVRRFGQIRQITGIDIGPKYVEGSKTATPAIRLHVVVKRPDGELVASEQFPSEIDGYPVDVLQRNYVPAIEGLSAPSGPPPSGAGRSPSIVPGISISHRLCPNGTLGVIVRDRSGAPALLTNWHILADSSFARIGDPVTQPGAPDGGTSADQIANVSAVLLDADGDAAIAILNDSRPVQVAIPGLDVVPRGVRDPRPGEVVRKCGRSTGVTRGRVEGRGTYFPIYRTRDRVGIDGFEVVPLDPGNPTNLELSLNGDSGSVWVSEETSEVVGLHFGGERDAAPEHEVALACFATRVFERLSISLAE